MNLALFDLDHTLLPIDSDHAWGEFLAATGAVDRDALRIQNDDWFQQYLAGTLDPVKYLEFVFGNLAPFPRAQLDAWHAEFMEKSIRPAITQKARDLVRHHQDAGDLVAIVTATCRFITGPIASEFGVDNLIAADAELTPEGNFTGKVRGLPTLGQGKITHTEAWLASMDKTIDSFPRSYFYSDSPNDLPLLMRVSDPVATNPSDKLRAYAKAHGWPVLDLFDTTA